MKLRVPSAPVAIVALLLAAPFVLADLETTFPPGTPNEWFRELPERIPHLRGVLEKPVEKKEEKKEEPKEEGGTATREKKKEAPKKEALSTVSKDTKVAPELGCGNYTPFLFSGVMTVDLPIHCGWVKRTGELTPRAYPPTITDDLYWQAQVTYLRRMLHPAMVGEQETYWRLLQLGDCSREATKGAKGNGFLAELAAAVEGAIPELPKDPPAVPDGGDTAEEKMLRHLVRDDLTDGDPYSLDPGYAARVLSLGEPAFEALKAAATSSHALLRRNAVVLIQNYPQDAVVDILRQLANDGDNTVRARALFALFKRKDEGTIPTLLPLLASDDKRMRPLAAFGLGMIGTKECVDPLVKALEKNKDDWDTIVACTIALARAGEKDAATAVPCLKKLEESLHGAAPRFAEPADTKRNAADNPDRDEVKNRMLLELATIALARLGDKDGLKKVDDLISGKWDGDPPMGFAKVSGPQHAEQCDCMKFVCPTSFLLLIETWSGRPAKETEPFLQQVVVNPKTNERLRSFALRADAIAKNKAFLMSVVGATESAALRGLALRQLTNLDEKQGAKLAEGILAAYNSNSPPFAAPAAKGDTSVVTALEVLYKEKKLKVDMLKAALQRAITEFVYDKPQITAEGTVPFHFSPPILETIAWMLGALQDKAALPLLKQLATSNTTESARAEAIRSLAHIPGEPTLQLLAGILDDDDGFMRYNAYLSLKALTGKDDFCDWIYGSKDERKEATNKYRELAKLKPNK